MTPKEKAEQLFKKMNGFRTSYAHRVKCANVVCDEMMEFEKIEFNGHIATVPLTFWAEVKIELEKLKEKKS